MGNNIIEDNILSVNTQNSRMKIISIEGNEKQENQDGTSNLLVLEEGSKSQDGITVTVENGEVTISGTATENTQLIIGKAYLHEGETYYIESVGTSSNCGFRLQNQKNGAQQHWFATSEEASFVAEATGEWDFYISTNEAQKPSTTNLKLRVSKESGIEWEQGFMNTPSFDYPSEIRAVGDNVNFFDDVLYTKFSANRQATKEVVGKTLKVTTIANQFSGVYLSTIFPEVADLTSKIKGKTVTYSFEAKADNNINLAFGKNGNEKIRQVSKKWRKLFITYENTNSCSIYFYNNSATVETFYIRNIKLEYGGYNSSYSDFNMGSIGLKISNKNFLNTEKDSSVESNGLKVTTDSNGILNLNGTTNNNIYLSLDLKHIGTSGGSVEQKHFKKGNYKFSCENLSSIQDLNVSAYIADKAVGTRKTFALLYKVFNQKTKTATASILEDTEAVVYLWIASGITLNNAKLKFQIELDNATEIIANEEQNYIIPVQQKMFSGDTFTKVDGSWKEVHTWQEVEFNGEEEWAMNYGTSLFNLSSNNIYNQSSTEHKALCNMAKFENRQAIMADLADKHFAMQRAYNSIFFKDTDFKTAEEFKAKLKELYEAGTPLKVAYKTDTPLILDCTPEQIEVLNKIMYLYNGISNIYTEDEIAPKIEVEIKKIVEDYDAYISNEGYFIIPEYDIKYLINLNESNIPSMPEATETSIKVAGRDGDVPLNTTYEPISFDLVCYTEDNLSVLEKSENEAKVNLFLNSIKNKTKKFAIERDMKFYDIKYNGSLTRTNYPAHLKFSIPFKSSDSYAKDLKDKMIVGNSSEESNTINNVGALFTIKGPATMPIISLNDYSMEYSTSILEGARIEIDSNKSTITHINSDGVKTNVMKYYNHQFPKIENGINILKVLSGVNNSNQVNVKWRDLKL